jgi:hypothetical protein
LSGNWAQKPLYWGEYTTHPLQLDTPPEPLTIAHYYMLLSPSQPGQDDPTSNSTWSKRKTQLATQQLKQQRTLKLAEIETQETKPKRCCRAPPTKPPEGTEHLSGVGTPHDAFRKETTPKMLTSQARKGRFSPTNPARQKRCKRDTSKEENDVRRHHHPSFRHELSQPSTAAHQRPPQRR